MGENALLALKLVSLTAGAMLAHRALAPELAKKNKAHHDEAEKRKAASRKLLTWTTVVALVCQALETGLNRHSQGVAEQTADQRYASLLGETRRGRNPMIGLQGSVELSLLIADKTATKKQLLASVQDVRRAREMSGRPPSLPPVSPPPDLIDNETNEMGSLDPEWAKDYGRRAEQGGDQGYFVLQDAHSKSPMYEFLTFRPLRVSFTKREGDAAGFSADFSPPPFPYPLTSLSRHNAWFVYGAPQPLVSTHQADAYSSFFDVQGSFVTVETASILYPEAALTLTLVAPRLGSVRVALRQVGRTSEGGTTTWQGRIESGAMWKTDEDE